MARPTVLVVDSNDARRRDVVRALAGFSYEVIAAADADEGLRFATGLAPGVIAAGADVAGFGDGAVLAELTPPDGQGSPPRLVVLGDSDEAPDELAEGVTWVGVGGLTSAAVVRKLRTLLVGMELGFGTDGRLESMVGDLATTPLFDLLQALHRAVVTGRVVLGDGELALAEGELVAARYGKARGLKALGRIVRSASGTFRVLLVPNAGEQEIRKDLLTVMAEALDEKDGFEEARGLLPDLASRARVEMGPAFFATHFSPTQQKLLELMHGAGSIWALLDAIDAPDGTALEDLVRLHQLGFVQFSEPEVRVRVVTDSTADLPAELALRHGIHVVPLSVIFGKDIYKDGVDILPGAFYKLLAERRDVHPATSPPTKGEFITGYRLLVPRSDIVSVHISEQLSQTGVNARAAATEGADSLAAVREDGSQPLVTVVDSRHVSVALGLLALFAARMARRGLAIEAIRTRLEAMRERFHLLFVVDTLEYLARGGRIGKARALLGGMLGIKPILGVVGGEVAPVDRVRGGKAAHPRLIELFKQRVDPERPVVVGLAHANAPVWADRLKGLIEQNFAVSEMMASEIGPVVGTHAGPGTVGACLFQPAEDEAPLIAPLPQAG